MHLIFCVAGKGKKLALNAGMRIARMKVKQE